MVLRRAKKLKRNIYIRDVNEYSVWYSSTRIVIRASTRVLGAVLDWVQGRLMHVQMFRQWSVGRAVAKKNIRPVKCNHNHFFSLKRYFALLK